MPKTKASLDRDIAAVLAVGKPSKRPVQDQRQRLLWIPFQRKGDISLASPLPVDFSQKEVAAVWTLPSYRDPNNPPHLPLSPVHGWGAFLEDVGHDWSIRGGNFIYRSRLTDQPVWVLVQLR